MMNTTASLKKLTVVATISLAASLISHAQSSQEDLWSAAGGAWSSSYQTNYSNGHSGSNGYLLPDVTANLGALLYVSNATSFYGGLYGDYYYTGDGAPSYSLQTSDILDGVNTITLTITAAAGSFSSNLVTLSINSTASSTALTSYSSASAGTVSGFDASTYTWTWDVSSISSSINNISLGWTDPIQHTAYTGISFTQSVTAVPEPREYALVVTGLLLVVVMQRRRRAMA